MFKRILIANRGEIALRIVWACRELGIETVAVYSEVDRDSLHVKFANQAICIGPASPTDSYLNIPAVISAAEISGAEAIHPGYGFLAENAYFAEVCESCNIKFIGPTPQMIGLMGNKSAAKEAMARAGLPTVPGSSGVVKDPREGEKLVEKIGFPIILKASANSAAPFRLRRRKRLPLSPCRICTSSAISASRATSRCRSSGTNAATSFTWASANARCSAGIRS